MGEGYQLSSRGGGGGGGDSWLTVLARSSSLQGPLSIVIDCPAIAESLDLFSTSPRLGHTGPTRSVHSCVMTDGAKGSLGKGQDTVPQPSAPVAPPPPTHVLSSVVVIISENYM